MRLTQSLRPYIKEVTFSSPIIYTDLMLMMVLQVSTDD